MTQTSLHRLGDNVRTMRKHRGLTQQQVALLAGVPRRKVSEIEHGAARVVIETYAKVIRVLGAELSVAPMRRPTLEEVRELFGDDE